MEHDLPRTDLPQNSVHSTTKYFFSGAMVTCVLGAALVALAPVPMPGWPMRGGLVLAWLAAALMGAITLRGRDAWSARFVFGSALLSMALLFVLAYATGQGLRTISLGFVALLICLVGLLAGLRYALVLCLAGLAGVLALVRLEGKGLIDTAASIARAPLADAVIAHALLLAGGLAAGVLVVHASARARRDVEARERQYAEVLAAAADHFWELDRELRFVQVQDTRAPVQKTVPPSHAGRHPWELKSVGMLPTQREAHFADLRAHRPFDNLQTRRPDAQGRTQHMSISGRPRFTVDGTFNGYWAVGRDVTALVEHQAALVRARDEAKAANRAKSAFLANMSHEIRTPLHGLVGLAELARDPATPETARREYLDRIGECAATLTAIIGDVLDLSRIEAGKLQIASADFDLHDLVNSMQRSYDMLGRARALKFSVELDPGVPRFVRGDAGHLRHILSNYLGNALKFTQQGSVCLRVQRQAGTLIRFEVQDTGIGIAPADQAQLFQAFTQVDNTRSRRYEGTGLGLSICRELAALMGGGVGLASEPGRGSRFWVELPLPLGEPVRDGGAEPATGAVRLQGLCVLLVEDNPVNQIIGKALLEGWGMVVVMADDGFQAVSAVESAAATGRLFDLVLMDLQMPGKSGYEAAAELRTRWDATTLPIIALTAAALDSERSAALASGMDDLVTKPIDSRRLQSVIQRVLKGPAVRQ